MARSRNIKPGFFTNEDLVELPFETRLLFIGLWCLADREGRMEYRPKKIKMQIFPADDVDIHKCVTGLHGAGMVQVYTIENIEYLQIVNFTKHQNPHVKEQPSTIPAPDSHGASPSDSLLLIPDSLNPLTDSLQSDSLSSDSPITDTGKFLPEEKKIVELKPDHARDVFEFWQSTMNHPRAAFDAKRKALINKQLKHYPVDDLKKAIHGCSVTPHNMGDNDRGEIYDSIELILRDAKQIDRFMRNSDSPPTGKIKTIEQTQREISAQTARVGKYLFGENYETN